MYGFTHKPDTINDTMHSIRSYLYNYVNFMHVLVSFLRLVFVACQMSTSVRMVFIYIRSSSACMLEVICTTVAVITAETFLTYVFYRSPSVK